MSDWYPHEELSPTMSLRWCNGTLEQMWKHRIENLTKDEWRAVPVVEGEQAVLDRAAIESKDT